MARLNADSTSGGKGLNTARILTQLGCSAIHLTHAGGAYKDIYLEENKKMIYQDAYRLQGMIKKYLELNPGAPDADLIRQEIKKMG